MRSPYTLTFACLMALAGGAANAAVYDLSSSGTDTVTVTGGTGGNAVFNTFFQQPAGTGYIDPFLRIQLQGQPNGYCAGTVTGRCEQGYNTDGIIEFDTKDDGSHNWTDAIMLGDIPIVTVNGIKYREFLLDINQNQGNPDQELLSLDELQFFTTTNPNITGYNDVTNMFGGGASLVWEMDTYAANRKSYVKNDYILLENCKSPGTCGSGDFDLQALIPSDVFGNDNSKYVVLFNRFGDNRGTTGANDGFEEWAVRVALLTPDGVSEPGILPLIAAGMIGGWASSRRRKRVS